MAVQNIKSENVNKVKNQIMLNVNEQQDAI